VAFTATTAVGASRLSLAAKQGSVVEALGDVANRSRSSTRSAAVFLRTSQEPAFNIQLFSPRISPRTYDLLEWPDM